MAKSFDLKFVSCSGHNKIITNLCLYVCVYFLENIHNLIVLVSLFASKFLCYGLKITKY